MLAALAPLRMVSASLCLSGPAGSLPSPSIAPSARWVWRSIRPGQHRVARPVDRGRPVAIAPRRDRGDPAVDDADALVGQDLGAPAGRSAARRGRRRCRPMPRLPATAPAHRSGCTASRSPHLSPESLGSATEVPQSTIAKVAKVGTSTRARTARALGGGRLCLLRLRNAANTATPTRGPRGELPPAVLSGEIGSCSGIVASR